MRENGYRVTGEIWRARALKRVGVYRRLSGKLGGSEDLGVRISYSKLWELFDWLTLCGGVRERHAYYMC